MTEQKNNAYLSQFGSLWKTQKSLLLFLDEHSTTDVEKFTELLKYATKKSKKPNKRLNWVDLSDIVYSIYIRIREADTNGDVVCCTCGTKMNWRESQACHYRSRGCYKYRFDDINVHAGCYKCNVLLSGNYRSYYIYIVNLYGKETEEMLWNDKELVKRDNDWYVDHLLERWDKIKFFKTRLGDK